MLQTQTSNVKQNMKHTIYIFLLFVLYFLYVINISFAQTLNPKQYIYSTSIESITNFQDLQTARRCQQNTEESWQIFDGDICRVHYISFFSFLSCFYIKKSSLFVLLFINW